MEDRGEGHEQDARFKLKIWGFQNSIKMGFDNKYLITMSFSVQDQQSVNQLLGKSNIIYGTKDKEAYCTYLTNQKSGIFFKSRKLMKIQSHDQKIIRNIVDSLIKELFEQFYMTKDHISKYVMPYKHIIIAYPNAVFLHQPIIDVLPNYIHKKLCNIAKINLMLAIAFALQDLHTNNICLRNLMPKDIVILSQQQYQYEISITNIKNSILIANKKSEKRLEEINNYTAPQIIQKKPYDKSCDIWSIGAIFYEILFETQFMMGDCIQISYPRKASTWVMNFFQKMFSRQPGNRQRIEDIIKLLKKAQLCALQTGKSFQF